MNSIWTIGFESEEGQVIKYAFSSKKKAQKFKKLYAKDYDIDEINLDPYDKEIEEGLIPFKFSIDMYGNLQSTQFESTDRFDDIIESYLGWDIADPLLEFDCNIVAKTQDEAIGKAKEKIMSILKSDKWSAPIDREIKVRESMKDQKGQCWYCTWFEGDLEQAIEYKKNLAIKINELIS
jgi:hypothetical protein